MTFKIIALVSGFIIGVISKLDYFGIVLLMAIESVNIPLPSEIIMPFSGYLIYKGQFNLYWAGFFGGLGCLLGSVISYWIGLYGGRPLIEQYGKYILISHKDLQRADNWFKRYGEKTVFYSRLLPIVRTYISFPAGIAKMNFSRFSLYSFLGSFLWSLGLAYLGVTLGEQWETLRDSLKKFDILIGIIIIIGIGWYIWRHIKNSKAQSPNVK